MCRPIMHAKTMHAPAHLRRWNLIHPVVNLTSNDASRNENPAWNKTVAKRNSMAPSHRNEKPGGRSQNGKVVPTSAGSSDAVQQRNPAKRRKTQVRSKDSFVIQSFTSFLVFSPRDKPLLGFLMLFLVGLANASHQSRFRFARMDKHGVNARVA